MLKRKRDVVSPEMRDALRANRDGRLTVDQWLSIVTQPLIWVIVLFALAALVFGPRMLLLTARFWWLGLLLLVLLIGVPVVLRARRYARLPVHFSRLTAGASAPFSRATTMYSSGDVLYRFTRRLSPSMRLSPTNDYLVYYLEDASERVLLSLIPADHEDADQFLPSDKFKLRFNRRSGA